MCSCHKLTCESGLWNPAAEGSWKDSDSVRKARSTALRVFQEPVRDEGISEAGIKRILVT